MSETTSHTRLYLTVPAKALEALEKTGELLERLCTRLDVACINLPLDHSGSIKADDPQKALVEHLQQKDIAVLAHMTSASYAQNRKSFEKALEMAVTMRCDGVHMTADETLYLRAREVLGPNAIIGVDCSSSKHQAMQLGERGADYVAFNAPQSDQQTGLDTDQPIELVELLDWWQQLFEVPCVAQDVPDQSAIETLLQLPADFIAIGPALWPALSANEELLSWLATKCPAQTGGSA